MNKWYLPLSLLGPKLNIDKLPFFSAKPENGNDHDSFPDIVLNGYWFNNPGNSKNQKWTEFTIDSAWFSQNTGKWMDNSYQVIVADINGTGNNDVVISQSENKVFPVAWYSIVDISAKRWEKHITGQIDYRHTLFPGDIDNDGDLDLLAAKLPRWDGLGPVLLFLNTNNGSNWQKMIISRQKGAYIGILGDIG